MNEPLEPTHPAGLIAAIDRLVAGSLDPAERRALLLLLDRTPDGWRWCALGFLEDQAWRQALTPPTPHRDAREDSSLRPQPKILRKTPRRFVYVSAAGLLIAGIVLSLAVRSAMIRPLELVHNPASITPSDPLAQAQVKLRSHLDQLPASEGSISADLDSVPGEPLGYVAIIEPGAGEASARQVPILAATAANERWFHEQPPAIPAYVKAQWERQGFQIEENRRLLGLNLQDGRQVAIPVDELALDYIGQEPL